MAITGANYEQLQQRLGEQATLYPVLVQEARFKKNTEDLVRRFLAFRSWSEYYEYEQSLREDLRNYFETIKGDQPQKPKFDLDMDKNKHEYFLFQPEQLLDNLVYAILHVLSKYGVQLRIDRDLLLFTSHAPEKGKWSYHLIIDNWMFKNNVEAKHFYKLIHAELSPEFKVENYVDPAVYSTFQQFRLLGNCKPGTRRFKQFSREWLYGGNLIRNPLEDTYQQFTHSLVSYTSYCRYLPQMVSATIGTQLDPVVLPEGIELETIVSLVSSEHYKFDRIRNGCLLFTRVRKGVELECEVCGRTHGGDNPYVRIIDGQILFFCRRNEHNRPKLLGRMQAPKKKNELRRRLKELDKDDETIRVLTNKQRLLDALSSL